ncbi:hypothetical protein T4A_14456 [Trichinella pseudospiralis]|uniref:Uncharacterized protein n=1 Tax=Trichinella pseudospiralis TaxID=6337 RepID=A0A0V1JWL7_TRIPS|nr:hypothetical protein T4A_14456 [Trichinella pseudospiralis]KRZ39386.1 hypothetical protein T4C_10229 [Trichinella pseudospiralis]
MHVVITEQCSEELMPNITNCSSDLKQFLRMRRRVLSMSTFCYGVLSDKSFLMSAKWFPGLRYANKHHLKIALSSVMVHLFIRLMWQVVASSESICGVQ